MRRDRLRNWRLPTVPMDRIPISECPYWNARPIVSFLPDVYLYIKPIHTYTLYLPPHLSRSISDTDSITKTKKNCRQLQIRIMKKYEEM